MFAPIQLSLAGNGRLVILTPQTVRRAYFQFTKVNAEYTGREKYRLNQLLHHQVKLGKSKDEERETTLLDGLHRSYLEPKKLRYLHLQDIKKIEKEINRNIILNDLALVEDEGRLLEGYGSVRGSGKNREKVQYICRYGMIFIIESIKRETVLRTEKIDLFWQNDDFDFHFVRYQGVLLSNKQSGIKLLFRHRLDFSRTWTCTLAQFQPRQIFQVKRIYPCPGFQIVNYC